MNSNEVIYNFKETEISKKRKVYLMKRINSEKQFFYGIFICLIIGAIITLYFAKNDICLTIIIFILMISFSLALIIGWNSSVVKQKLYSNLDLTIRPEYLEIPGWNKENSLRVFKFPTKYIESIYWNPDLEYFVIISNNEGIDKFKFKFKYKIIQKKLIEYNDYYLQILKNNNIDVKTTSLTYVDCVKKYGS